MVEGIKFSKLKIGDKGEITKIITEEDVKKFVEICGDVNPIHVDEEFVSKTPLKTKIVHGHGYCRSAFFSGYFLGRFLNRMWHQILFIYCA